MNNVEFGSIGVNVENYTPDSIYKLFIENGLDAFIGRIYLGSAHKYTEGRYLQTEFRGPLVGTTTVCVLSGYILYTTDMETYLLILRTALLDIDAANALVNGLYHQGLIKPRTILCNKLTLVT